MIARPADPLPLARRVRDEIARGGAMTFARFMDHALHDPTHGYYAAGPRRLGTEGDYVTASDAGHEFGRCFARQIAEIDRRVGPFVPFRVVEFGAGRGLLARDILDAMPRIDSDLAGRLEYVMIDRSAEMRRVAASCVPEARCLAPGDLTDPAPGCVIAVELFDALGVHRLRRRAGRRVEVLVDVRADGELFEREGPPTPAAEALAERYGAASVDGTEAEVAPQAAAMLDALAASLSRGVVIIVDYGDRASALYGPARPHGTLLAYRRHQAHTDYLARPGEQDLTAHVNFSALEDRARELGLEVLGLTTQDRFLVALGLTEVFETTQAPGARPGPAEVRRRLQALQLIHPQAMGRAFKFLLLAKDCHPVPPLSGLVDPFSREKR